MKTFVICLIVMLLSIPARGQWEYGGKSIGIGQPEVYPCLAPDGRGGVFVAWQGCTDALDSSYIMLNHFDTSGTALFGEEGIAVARSPIYNIGEPQVASDGLGGCFVLWGQILPGETPMYLQRIGYHGEQLWAENKRLIYRSGYVYSYLGGLQLLADTSFGAIAVCVFDTGGGGWEILGQRIDYEGNILWDSTGLHVLDFISNPGRLPPAIPKLCISGSHFYCAWIDNRNNQTNGDIYLQRFDIYGNLYFGPGGLPISILSYEDGDIFERQSLQIAPDGFNGVVVSWLSGGSTLRAQRISEQGNPYWQINGMRIIDVDNSNRFGLGLYKVGNTFWVIVLGGGDPRYQKIGLNGNMAYGDTGYAVIDTVYATSINDDTLYLLNRIWRTFYCSKKDTSWNEYWINHPFFHDTGDRSLEILADGLGGLYAVINDYRDWNTDWVILQRIYPDGYIGGDTTGIDESEPAILPESPFNLTNYPNPFNSSTLITFNVDSKSKVKLNIYDSLGRMIDTIEFGQLSVGRHSYLWDIEMAKSKIASGIYIMSLEAGNRIETRRIVILK